MTLPAHVGELLASTLSGGAVVGLALKFGPSFFAKEIDKVLVYELGKLQEPELALFKDILKYASAKYPNDAKPYEKAVDALLTYLPTLAPLRAQLIQLLEETAKDVKQDLDKDSQ